MACQRPPPPPDRPAPRRSLAPERRSRAVRPSRSARERSCRRHGRWTATVARDQRKGREATCGSAWRRSFLLCCLAGATRRFHNRRAWILPLAPRNARADVAWRAIGAGDGRPAAACRRPASIIRHADGGRLAGAQPYRFERLEDLLHLPERLPDGVRDPAVLAWERGRGHVPDHLPQGCGTTDQRVLRTIAGAIVAVGRAEVPQGRARGVRAAAATGFPQSVVLCGVRDIRDYRIRSSAGEIIASGSPFNVAAKSLCMGDFTKPRPAP